MNAILPGIALAALTTSALADGRTFTTLTGRTYADAQVAKFEENAVIVNYAGGVTKIALVNLSPEARTALGIDDFFQAKQKKIDDEKKALEKKAQEEAAAMEAATLKLCPELLTSDYPAELGRQIAGYNTAVNEVNHWLTLAFKQENPALVAEYKVRADKLKEKLDRDLKIFDEYKAVLGGAGRANAIKIASAVSEGSAFIGMPRVAIRVSKGEPSAIHIRKTPYGESEQWVFRSDSGFQFYYFEDGRLTGAQQ